MSMLPAAAGALLCACSADLMGWSLMGVGPAASMVGCESALRYCRRHEHATCTGIFGCAGVAEQPHACLCGGLQCAGDSSAAVLLDLACVHQLLLFSVWIFFSST
jgi:hypothetical protein